MMRPGVDQLQANLLMVSGLSQLDDGFNVFGMPFFFQSDDETAYVEQKLTPILEKRLEAKGFRLLCWGSGGWVQLFSKKPLTSLDDVRRAKLFTSQGDDKMVQWYKRNGFNPVSTSYENVPVDASCVDTPLVEAFIKPTGEKSTPVTSQPLSASHIVLRPSPQPRSTARPGARPTTSATRNWLGVLDHTNSSPL